MAGQPAVDTVARERAAAVEGRLDAHEKYCAERWSSTTKSIDSLDQKIGSLDTKLSQSISKVHEKIDRFARYSIWVIISIAGFAIVQWLVYARVIFTGGAG